jgi:hypothetical protein
MLKKRMKWIVANLSIASCLCGEGYNLENKLKVVSRENGIERAISINVDETSKVLYESQIDLRERELEKELEDRKIKEIQLHSKLQYGKHALSSSVGLDGYKFAVDSKVEDFGNLNLRFSSEGDYGENYRGRINVSKKIKDCHVGLNAIKSEKKENESDVVYSAYVFSLINERISLRPGISFEEGALKVAVTTGYNFDIDNINIGGNVSYITSDSNKIRYNLSATRGDFFVKAELNSDENIAFVGYERKF